jgi:hypothetical protein
MHKLAMLFVLIPTCAFAQVPGTPSPERQNAIIQALIAQRDDANNRNALCSADSVDLNKQIADLKAKLEEKK